MWLNTLLCSECFVILNWYHSPCLSWDPPKEDDSGHVALLGRGATGVGICWVHPSCAGEAENSGKSVNLEIELADSRPQPMGSNVESTFRSDMPEVLKLF